jgi:hypothetical protein
MSDIKLKPNIFRIAVFENEIEIRRTLAESIEVVVVAERDAHIGSSFTQFSEEPAKPFAIIGTNQPCIRRELINI